MKQKYQKVDCSTMNNWKQNIFGEHFNPETNLFKDSIDAGKIINRLYLGSWKLGGALLDGLKGIGVTHILIMGSNMIQKFPDEFTYKQIEIEDTKEEDISLYFKETSEFIKNALAENETNVVFVHCYAGMSRSSTIVICYLMQEKFMSYIEALETCRRARHWVRPNSGFTDKLMKLNRKLNRSGTKEEIELYEQAFLILRHVNQGTYKINPVDKQFIVESFKTVFGKNHENIILVEDELSALFTIE